MTIVLGVLSIKYTGIMHNEALYITLSWYTTIKTNVSYKFCVGVKIHWKLSPKNQPEIFMMNQSE